MFNLIGHKKLIKRNINNNKIIRNKSLKINKGLRLIWSKLLLILIGLWDFFIWRIIKWIIEIKIINKANKKCKEKNRFSKILLINWFPQIKVINLFPIKGIIAKKFVITILAQKDIWLIINE